MTDTNGTLNGTPSPHQSRREALEGELASLPDEPRSWEWVGYQAQKLGDRFVKYVRAMLTADAALAAFDAGAAKKMARAPAMGDARIQKAKSRIVGLFDPPGVEKKPKIERPPSLDRTGYTDFGNAERLLALHGKDLRYDIVRDGWRAWSSATWEYDESFEVERRYRDAILEMYTSAKNAPPGDDVTALLDWAHASEGTDKMRAALAQARGFPGIPVRREELDSHPFLLNVANGTINLRNGVLYPHRREDLLTRITPVAYSPEAECPQFIEFLGKIFEGNEPLIEFMRRFTGYSLTADVSEQCFLVLHGKGKNGKSTLLNILRGILGSSPVGYSMQAAFKTFVEQRGDRIRSDIASLDGARFVAAVETSESMKLDEQMIKILTGSECVRAERKYENDFEFFPICKIWLATNHLPAIHGSDEGIWRRPRLVPFRYIVPPEQRDPNLAERLLREEGPGILNWAVRGCVAWLGAREGGSSDALATPDEVFAAIRNYRTDQDLVGSFVESCCDIGGAYRAKAGDLFRVFETWAKDNAEVELSQTAFGRRLREHGYEKLKSIGVIYWQGLALKNEYVPSGSWQEPRDS